MKVKILFVIIILVLLNSGCEVSYHNLSYNYIDDNVAEAYSKKFSNPFHIYEENLEKISTVKSKSLLKPIKYIDLFLKKYYRYNYTFEDKLEFETINNVLDNELINNNDIINYFDKLNDCIYRIEGDLNIDSLYINDSVCTFIDTENNSIIRLDIIINWKMYVDRSFRIQSEFPAIHKGDNIYFISLYLKEQNDTYKIVAWLESSGLYGQTMLFSSNGMSMISDANELDNSLLSDIE